MTLQKFIGFEIDIPSTEAGECDDMWNEWSTLDYVTGKTADGNPYRSNGIVSISGGIPSAYRDLIVDISGSPTELWIQLWIYRPSGGLVVDTRTALTTGLINFWDTNGTLMFTFGMEDYTVGEHLQLRRGNTEGALLDTGSDFVRGHDALFQIHYLAGNASGEIQVYRDGNLDMEYTGDTTAGLTTIGNIHFGILRFLDGSTAKGSTGNFEFDDFAYDTTGYPNNLSSKLININGTGNYAQWDLTGAATTHECIDEANDGGAPDDDTTLISTAVNDERASVTNTDGFTAENEGVVAVKALGRVGGPTDEDMLFFLRVGGIDYDGTQFTPAAWDLASDMWLTNPNTGLAWAEGDIVNIEVGVQQKAQ